jgi:cell wall-associated NlpC family hydrolase
MNIQEDLKMRKKLLSSIVAASILISTVPINQSITFASTQAEIIRGVSFREGPSLSSDRIRYLKDGETVEIISTYNAYWYKVKDKNGDIGFTSTKSKYINTIENSNPSSFKETNAEVIRGVSFRTGPSTDHSRIRYLKSGETVAIIEQVNSYWYKAKDQNGTIGYISNSSKYINTSYSNDSSPEKTNVQSSDWAQKVISSGMKYLGTPYEFGSSRYNTETFDCSDFVRQAYLDGIGLKLPMDSRKQGQYVRDNGKITTNWRDLKPGDIMFFMSYQGYKSSDYRGIDPLNQRITHNGIYLGDGKVLHTYSKKAGGVKIDNIEGRHWEFRFLFGGSPIK